MQMQLMWWCLALSMPSRRNHSSSFEMAWTIDCCHSGSALLRHLSQSCIQLTLDMLLEAVSVQPTLCFQQYNVVQGEHGHANLWTGVLKHVISVALAASRILALIQSDSS